MAAYLKITKNIRNSSSIYNFPKYFLNSRFLNLTLAHFKLPSPGGLNPLSDFVHIVSGIQAFQSVGLFPILFLSGMSTRSLVLVWSA